MAGRLITAPHGLGVVSGEPLAGPRAVGSGATQSVGNFEQTYSSPFGLWRWQFSFRPMMDDLFRRYRGWVTALHGGANATRWTFHDPDMLKLAQAGVTPTSEQERAGMPWANGEPWDIPGSDPWFNTANWNVSQPLVAVAAAALLGATEVKLGAAFWGHKLQEGDYLGFTPFHFGLYTVTEVFAPGHYRIWPGLRRAISADDLATLSPVLAMRLEGEEAAGAGRGLVAAEGLTVTLVEVLDYDVRDYFMA